MGRLYLTYWFLWVFMSVYMPLSHGSVMGYTARCFKFFVGGFGGEEFPPNKKVESPGANDSELSRGHPKWWFTIPPKHPEKLKFRNYTNLPRIIWSCLSQQPRPAQCGSQNWTTRKPLELVGAMYSWADRRKEVVSFIQRLVDFYGVFCIYVKYIMHMLGILRRWMFFLMVSVCAIMQVPCPMAIGWGMHSPWNLTVGMYPPWN